MKEINNFNKSKDTYNESFERAKKLIKKYKKQFDYLKDK